MIHNEYDWLEIKMRPKKDGLHDSGYRFIQITGVWTDSDGELRHDELHQWSDHVSFSGFMDLFQGINIDFTEGGVMRIIGWGGVKLKSDDVDMFFSSATFKPFNTVR